MPVMSRVESAFCRSMPWTEFARRAIVPWALQGERLEGDVLELGCGSGAMAETVATDFPDVRLTATDLDPAMVAATERRLAAYPDTHAEVADVTKLPFADRSFDVVTSYLMLHHVIDWERAVHESFRVLRPGGRLIGYDLDDTFAARAVHVLDRSPYRLIAAAQLEPELRSAGYKDTYVQRGIGRQVFRFTATRLIKE